MIQSIGWSDFNPQLVSACDQVAPNCRPIQCADAAGRAKKAASPCAADAKGRAEEIARGAQDTYAHVRDRVSDAASVVDESVQHQSLVALLVAATLACVLGLLLAWAAIPVISAAVTGLLPPLLLSKTMLSLGLVFAVFVGVVSGLLPGIGAMRMRVVNALRRV